MKINVERGTFLKALGHVQSVVERRNTIPILSNVLIQAAKGRLKWESLVRAASKQSRRTRLPEVLDVLDSRGVARWLAGVQCPVLLHEDAEVSLAQYWARTPAMGAATVAVIVGPEGGISPQEVELFVNQGAVAVQLGSNVLRASTAGPAAIAVLNQLSGRW